MIRMNNVFKKDFKKTNRTIDTIRYSHFLHDNTTSFYMTIQQPSLGAVCALIPNNCTSNTRSAFGGMTPFPAPSSPYPKSLVISKTAFSPKLINKTPSSQPLMTCPNPILNENGCPRSYELSNCLPLDFNVPLLNMYIE